ncbi:MAG: hypothetical protein IPJ65_43755 [Archangiaceae bacterium]|nr:hypothetical protein [Archangiaceae bacterium]
MKSNLVALAAGALFAVGLVVSGMAQPAKVQGFLDLTGDWDASLALVMVGAISVHATALRLIARRRAPLFMPSFQPRQTKAIDGQLLLGAATFGAGWGLAGYCPGPAFVAVGGASPSALVFVVAMTAGMLVHRQLQARARAVRSPSAT